MFIEIDWRGGNQGGVISKSRRREEKIFIKSIRIVFSCVCILKSISDTHFHVTLSTWPKYSPNETFFFRIEISNKRIVWGGGVIRFRSRLSPRYILPTQSNFTSCFFFLPLKMEREKKINVRMLCFRGRGVNVVPDARRWRHLRGC